MEIVAGSLVGAGGCVQPHLPQVPLAKHGVRGSGSEHPAPSRSLLGVVSELNDDDGRRDAAQSEREGGAVAPRAGVAHVEDELPRLEAGVLGQGAANGALGAGVAAVSGLRGELGDHRLPRGAPAGLHTGYNRPLWDHLSRPLEEIEPVTDVGTFFVPAQAASAVHDGRAPLPDAATPALLFRWRNKRRRAEGEHPVRQGPGGEELRCH